MYWDRGVDRAVVGRTTSGRADVGRAGAAGALDEKQLAEKQYRHEHIAYQVEREDGLANYRLTWTLHLNGFLFAALALIGPDMAEAIRNKLKVVVPVAGATVSFAGLLGTVAVLLVIRKLRTEWENDKELKKRFPRPFGTGWAFYLGQATNIMVPVILLAVWFHLIWVWVLSP